MLIDGHQKRLSKYGYNPLEITARKETAAGVSKESISTAITSKTIEMNDCARPGLAILQSNLPEQLRQLFLAHIEQHPLEPLEEEVVLVQSSGIGRWLELGMAESRSTDPFEGGLGISASVRFELPARFLWKAYRAVLGDARIPENSLFDADRLRWMVFRLLDPLGDQPELTPLARYLAVDPGDEYRRFQLAGEIADLFETYQFFRADWLVDWEAGRDVLRQANHGVMQVPTAQAWQPLLWRSLIEAAGPAGKQHRGQLHADFVSALEQSNSGFPGLPRRISVFGITTLPEQSLRALAALSRHLQVSVFVHNPCRYYWGNIIEARDVHRRWKTRHQARPGMPQGALEDKDLAVWGHPLLASWGKQGRDYIGLLDRMDRPEDYADWFDDRIDLFDDTVRSDNAPLLHQIQQSILDLEPRPSRVGRKVLAANENSVRFVSAHGRQREVEILHDDLLECFKNDYSLKPREIIVMVPDIEDYAPNIEAVFGQFAAVEGQRKADRRFIPYSIGDRGARADSGFLRTVEVLLDLPRWRVTANEVLDLLQIPAVRARFGVDAADMRLVERWLEGAGVRWGIDQEHRRQILDAEDAFDQNSWSFGLDRMMLGYACGQRLAWDDIVAYDEITAGEADLVASLRELLASLRHWRKELTRHARPEEWIDRIRNLVAAFVRPVEAEDSIESYRLEQALTTLIDSMHQAGIDQPFGLDILASALTDQLEKTGTGNRFLVGKVSFCTMMPMRAIPFRVVCLLGMNDGEYPRTRRPVDFDLMEVCPRPGDRSRRDDDRYLFLEALLSARDRLYVSWVGRSARDNAELPASVLVGQLRDFIAAGWRRESTALVSLGSPNPASSEASPLDHLTVEHPLQPFSKEYFRPGQERLRTHALEWADVWKSDDQFLARGEQVDAEAPLGLEWPDEPLHLKTLSSFLKSPTTAFLTDRLQAKLKNRGDIGGPGADEPIELNDLEKWNLRDELLRNLMLDDSGDTEQEALSRHLSLLSGQGQLPLGLTGKTTGDALLKEALQIGKRFFARVEHFGPPIEKQPVRLDFSVRVGEQTGRIRIEDWLPPMHGHENGEWARIVPTASKIGSALKTSWEKLAGWWVDHLAASAAGFPMQTIIVARDRDLVLTGIESAQAKQWLEDLTACWLMGHTRPLPVDPVTAGEFLWRKLGAADKPEEEWLDEALWHAANRHVGSDFSAGRVERVPALARFHPEFERMLSPESDDGFRYWSERIYGRMVTFYRAESKNR